MNNRTQEEIDAHNKRWKSHWKTDKDSEYNFSHIVNILIGKHGWTELPCFVNWGKKKKYEYKVSE